MHHPHSHSNSHLALVFWETTVACNLECVHCRRLEVGKELSREDLKLPEIYRFIEGLGRDFPRPPILVLSGGEPLYRPDIFDIVAFAKEKNVPVALASNGTLVDQPMAKKIAGSGIKRVSVSLDGSRSDTHDKFRKMPGSFAKAIQGIKRLRALGMSIQINTTFTKHNLGELEDIYRLCLELGADAMHCFLLVPVGCGLEIKSDFQMSPQEYEDTLKRIYKISSEEKLHIRPVCAPHYFRLLVQEKSPLLRKNGHPGMNQISKGCLAGSGICFVSNKGEVFPCGYMPIDCGNIKQDSMKTIWDRSQTLISLRDPELLEGKCGICEYKKICSGCRARAFEETGDYLNEEPKCLYEPDPAAK